MNLRLLAVLAVLVLAPLVSLAWLGARFAADARLEVLHRFDEVIEARLAEQAAGVGRLMAEKQRQLLDATADLPDDADGIRQKIRRDARFRFLLVLDHEGRRVFPPADGPVSEAEQAFVERTRGLWQGRALSRMPKEKTTPEAADAQQQQQGIQPPVRKGAPADSLGNGPGNLSGNDLGNGPANGMDPADDLAQVANGPGGAPTIPLSTVANEGPAGDAHGWHVWYWGGGLNLMFWRREPQGRIVAVEVDRVRLLADVVARLPDTIDEAAEEQTTLLDSSGEIIYQWGAWVPPAELRPRLLHALPAPLNAWRLAWVGRVPTPEGWDPNLLAGLIGVGIALVGLAIWFYHESTRALREAAQRVTFVNQVSHELKTPLTNIRMYAELLEEELEDDDRLSRHVGVIVGESQRLSRLIGNILTFARKQRETLKLRPQPTVLDAVVQETLDHFAPALARTGVAVAFTPGAPATVAIDRDAVEQILANLLSNVEKYAPGGPVRLATRQTATESWVTVHDSGPGIARGDRHRIFEPFERLSNALTEGASGTGIGLGIARDLAHLHGGDLHILSTERGACFELRLRHA